MAKRRTPVKASAKNETLEWVKSVGIAIVLFLFIRTFLVQAYSIPSESMERTLLVGDYLMANNAIFGAHLPWWTSRSPRCATRGRGRSWSSARRTTTP